MMLPMPLIGVSNLLFRRVSEVLARKVKCVLATLMASTLIGCAGEKPPESAYPGIRIAARNAAYALADQISRSSWIDTGAVWVAPAINFHSGEITASGRELQIMMALDLKSALGDVVVQSLGGEERQKWNWVLSPSVTFERPQALDSAQAWFRVDIAVVNPSGKSLPGLSFRVNASNFDATPSRFYREAPLFLTGQYQQTRHEFAKGSRSLISQEKRNRFLSVEGRLQEAVLKYEAGDFRQALTGFSSILHDDPDNLAALSGRYQSLHEVGNAAEIEVALGQLVRAAISQGNISLKFLFQVRSVDFRDDAVITRRYQLWLKQMAKQLLASEKCVTVVGHASRSGSAEFNQQLSLSRAKLVLAQLLRFSPELKGRVRVEGRGYLDNLVGSGSDDSTDAIDRRVDFRLENCRAN